jgi:hypothetical protein
MHLFVHLRRPLERPLPPMPYLVPPLYLEDRLDEPMPMHGSVRWCVSACCHRYGAHSLTADSDACSQPIRGAWMRCGACATSFDLVRHDSLRSQDSMLTSRAVRRVLSPNAARPEARVRQAGEGCRHGRLQCAHPAQYRSTESTSARCHV